VSISFVEMPGLMISPTATRQSAAMRQDSRIRSIIEGVMISLNASPRGRTYSVSRTRATPAGRGAPFDCRRGEPHDGCMRSEPRPAGGSEAPEVVFYDGDCG